MKRRYEVNRMIQEKIESLEAEENVKEFVLEILKYERENWKFGKPHYSEPYEKLVHRFSRKSESREL